MNLLLVLFAGLQMIKVAFSIRNNFSENCHKQVEKN
jgi:hypothetical protein